MQIIPLISFVLKSNREFRVKDKIIRLKKKEQESDMDTADKPSSGRDLSYLRTSRFRLTRLPFEFEAL